MDNRSTDSSYDMHALNKEKNQAKRVKGATGFLTAGKSQSILSGAILTNLLGLGLLPSWGFLLALFPHVCGNGSYSMCCCFSGSL